jgi:hypothetical protein
MNPICCILQTGKMISYPFLMSGIILQRKNKYFCVNLYDSDLLKCFNFPFGNYFISFANIKP